MKEQEIIIGTPVIYYDLIKDDGSKHYPFETEITSEPWELGHGEIVCRIKGKSGGVSIRHLERREL